MSQLKAFAVASIILISISACTDEQMQEGLATTYGGQVAAFFRPLGNGTSALEVSLFVGANKPWTCQGTVRGEDPHNLKAQQVPLTCFGITRSGVANLANDSRTGGLIVDYHLDGDLTGRVIIN